MTNDEVWSAVIKWVNKITGVKTIMSHQSGPAPTGQYVVVNFTGAIEVRQHEQCIEYEESDDVDTGDVHAPIIARPVIEMEWRFSVHAYGENPTDTLRPVVSAHKLTQTMEPIFPNLTIHEISQIRNVPDWINETWRQRAQMDVVVRGLIRDGHVVDVIEETPPITFERQN
jgi:hypothetical protein